MSRNALADQMLGALGVYAQRYGLPESPAQLEGVVGSLLHIKTQADNVGLTTAAADRVIKQVMDNFNPQTLSTAIADYAKQALADQAYQWRQQLEHEVKDTLNAYVQNYAPAMTVDHIRDAVMATMPLINGGPVTKAEVTGLVSQMAETFDLEGALSARVNPIYVGVAKNLAMALSQKPMETAVSETVTAYIEKFTPTLENVSEDLIENALSAVLKNKVEFGLGTDLNLADKQLLINQISFKLNIMEQSPPPSKTAQQMAAELGTAIDQFKKQREEPLGKVDLATGLGRPDGLSGVSGWTSTRRDGAGSEPESSG